MEVWKTVIVNGEVYENYMVSNWGNFKSLNYRNSGKEKILKFGKDKKNYLRVNLFKDGKRKTCLIHRLVAEAFIPKIEGKTHVDHIDGNPSNNVYTNLRWCTIAENNNFDLYRKHQSENSAWKGKSGESHHRSKAVLCVETGKIYGSTREVERELKINQSSISACCRRERNSAGKLNGEKLHWKYL